MKLTAILLLAACLQVSAKSYSQRVTISGKNMPLQQVFKEITKQTGYYFIYKEKWTAEFKNVDVLVNNAPLEQTLDLCFRNQPYTYAIIEKTVVVKPKIFIAEEEKMEKGLLGEIKGLISSDNGPVVGANIVVKRTGKGTSSAANGQFSLPDVNEEDILVISSIGYQKQEVSLKDKKGFVYVQLKVAVDKLDEIQILAYGGATTRRLSTSSVTRVTSEEIQKQPVNNILQALVGRTAGMSISQTSGLPGSDISFQIRGQNSLNTTTFTSTPLVVIDGVPYPNVPINDATKIYGGNAGNNIVASPIGYGSPLYNINPNDIESVEILKDADATAIYGSRAANGVMLITTKKGKQGRTKIDVNVNTGLSLNLRQVDLLNVDEYRAMRQEAFKNSNATPTITTAPDLLVWDSTRNTNWQKELLGHTANITDVSLSMSGGAGGTSFLISGNYHKENTVYPDRRGSESGGAHYSISHSSNTGKFSATLSGMISSNKLKLPQGSYGSYAYIMPPNFQPFDSAGNLKWDWINVNYSTQSSNAQNPYALMRADFSSETFSLTSNLQLRYNILPGLDLKSSFGLTRVQTEQQTITPRSASNPYNTFFLNSNLQNISRSQTLNFEPQINYIRNIAKGKLDAMVGATIMKTVNEMPSAITARNFTSDAYINNITLASFIAVQQEYSAYQYASVFARANYNWQNKYILNGSFRRDGSSRFGPNNRYGNFGAIGAAWLFNKEAFAQNLHFLSYGKLRGSLGWVGSDNIGDYSFISTYSPGFFTYGGNPGLGATRLYNPDYSWESTRKLEAAMELGFLRDRILLSAAWFQSRSGNQLVNYPVSTQAGFGSYAANLNAAVVENTGWEIELNTTNISGKSFRWNTSFNITIPQNKLLRFDGIENTGYVSSLVVGKPLSSIFNVHFTGLDSAGKPQYEDVNKNGTIDWFGGLAEYGKGDRRYTGKTYADYYGGLTNSFSYKGIQLDFTFQFTGGLTKPNYLSAISQPGSPNNLPRKTLQDLRAKGLDKYYLKSTYVSDYLYYTYPGYSDASYMNVNFIRLTNAALSYSLPEKMIKPYKVSNLKAYLQAQNLFVISNYDGFDPESGATAMPPLFRLVAGIQCSF